MKKRLPTKEWKRIFSKVPRIVVDLVIKDGRGIVLAKRENTYGAGQWNLPGGNILFGESVKHAVMRKAEEETGLNVKIVKFIGVFEYPIEKTFGHPISLVFLCRPTGGKLRGDKFGRDIRFFKKLPKIGFSQIDMIKERKMIR